MNLKRIISLAAVVAGLCTGHVFAAVGYVNVQFAEGENLFGNPLDNGTGNLLSDLVAAPPDGTVVSLWNSATASYGVTSTFDDVSGWDSDFALLPGTGALLVSPAGAGSWFNTFVGQVLNGDGTVWAGDPQPLLPPPPFAGPSGVYLLSSIVPKALAGSGDDSVFRWVVGRPPEEGEVFMDLDVGTQTYNNSTFFGGAWDNGDPSLNVAEAAFFTLQGVPEPGAFALVAALSLAGFAAYRRLRV